ncbi:AMP-binding enzyme [Sesbania bispinosa]|nr:AMP-binding enzyme [Sesbania bispinosa]
MTKCSPPPHKAWRKDDKGWAWEGITLFLITRERTLLEEWLSQRSLVPKGFHSRWEKGMLKGIERTSDGEIRKLELRNAQTQECQEMVVPTLQPRKA